VQLKLLPVSFRKQIYATHTHTHTHSESRRGCAWKVIKNWVKWHMRAEGIKQFGNAMHTNQKICPSYGPD